MRPASLRPNTLQRQGFIYGLPIVMNYVANYQFWIDQTSSQYKCPMNQIYNESRVFTYKDTAVVTPNSDTPYSFVCLDLRAEPYVISVPAVEKERYYSVQLTDWNTFNYGYIGSRATGNEAGDYLIAGPDWNGATPAGIKKVFHSTSQFTLAIFRTQLLNADDLPKVQKVQAGYHAVPLSAYLHQPAPLAAPAINFPPVNADMVKTNFFQYLDFALQFAPAGPEEKEFARSSPALASARESNSTLTPSTSNTNSKWPWHEGWRQAGGRPRREPRQGINGWRVGSAFGDRAYYHWRLATARRRRQGRHLWQQCRRGDVSHGQGGCHRRTA